MIDPRAAATAAASAAVTPRDSAAPRPVQNALAPAVIVTTGAADLVDSRLADFGGRAAIVAADGRTGEVLLAIDPDAPVFAASLYKLGVLLEAERRIDEGTLRPDDLVTITEADQGEDGSFTAAGSVLTIDEALERAIAISDNAAALALIRRLGVPAIHATLAREGIGLRFTSDGAVTSARAIATFFGELVRGSLVSRAASARMLARLSRQRVADRFPAALPAGAVIAHKTGNLGFATHDAGIVRGPAGAPIVLVVLTWDSGEQEAIDLIREVAAVIYGSLSPTTTH
ncbi:MAG: serine hydrolase [Chloroflexota bacterium]